MKTKFFIDTLNELKIGTSIDNEFYNLIDSDHLWDNETVKVIIKVMSGKIRSITEENPRVLYKLVHNYIHVSYPLCSFVTYKEHDINENLGIEIGMKLKMYTRKDIYGRHYISITIKNRVTDEKLVYLVFCGETKFNKMINKIKSFF